MQWIPSTGDGRIKRVITLFFVVGFILTIISKLQICSDSCGPVHAYKFYGFDFEWLGILFFATVGLMHFFNVPYLGAIIAMAVGSEINFIRVQKVVIEQWCPICLTIALVVFVIALLSLIRYTLYGGNNMHTISNWFGKSALVALGFVIAYFGVFKPEKSFADGLASGELPYFGNSTSNVEVYVITDWFCPSCRAAEPQLEAAYASIMKRARLFFIDLPIHSESMNYAPYNFSFMLKNKPEYFQIRHALSLLTKQTKEPSSQEINDAVKGLGVKYQPLNFADVNDGVKFNEGIVKTFKVRATPTVVIANRKKLNAQKLVASEITKENILRAIDKVQGGK